MSLGAIINSVVDYSVEQVKDPAIRKLTNSFSAPGVLTFIEYVSGIFRDNSYKLAHYTAGATIGSLLYSQFQKKMSKKSAGLATTSVIFGFSAIWETYELYIRDVPKDDSLEIILDTCAAFLGFLTTAVPIDYLVDRSISSSSKDEESSVA